MAASLACRPMNVVRLFMKGSYHADNHAKGELSSCWSTYVYVMMGNEKWYPATLRQDAHVVKGFVNAKPWGGCTTMALVQGSRHIRCHRDALLELEDWGISNVRIISDTCRLPGDRLLLLEGEISVPTGSPLYHRHTRSSDERASWPTRPRPR